jgi:hypothetical protein
MTRPVRPLPRTKAKPQTLHADAALLRDLASLLFASARARGVTIGGRHPVAEALGGGR